MAHKLGLGVRHKLLLTRTGRRGEAGVWTGNVEVPMFAVHLANHVGTATLETVVKVTNLIAPAAVGSTLLVRVEVVLPAVKHAVWCGGWRNAGCLGGNVREASVCSNLQHATEAPKQSSSSAGLEHHLVGEDEHARLGQEVCIDMLRLDDGENLAVDQIEHVLPGIRRHLLQSSWTGLSRQFSSGSAEPYLQELLGTLERVGRVEIDSSLLVDGQVRGANMRRGRGSVVLRNLSSDHLSIVWLSRAQNG
ncbi:hypothetical protein CUC08_Gglean001120 [Alternaria sp. MG1]|nr:hypothetical protein CUC08_Gglean001120 [Alternaria sp. MG1]